MADRKNSYIHHVIIIGGFAGLYAAKILGNSPIQVTLIDNGIGLPGESEFKDTESLGLQLVKMLVDQIGGTIKLHRNGGTEFKITFSS